MFEVDLSERTDADLAVLLETMRDLAVKGGRFFFDCYILIERESVKRVKVRELSEYSSNDLGNAVVTLTHILNERDIPDDGERKTIRALLGIACGEVNRRQHDRVVN